MFDPSTISAINKGEFEIALGQISEGEPIQKYLVKYLEGSYTQIEQDLLDLLEKAVLESDWKKELKTTIILSLIKFHQGSIEELEELIEQAELIVAMHEYPKTNADEFWYFLFLLNQLTLLVANEDIHRATDIIKKLEPIYSSMRINQFLYDYLNSTADVYSRSGKYNISLSYYHEVLMNKNKISNDLQKSVLENLSTIYQQKGHLNIALYYYHQLLDELDQIKDADKITKTLRDIAMIYLSKAEYTLALKQLERSMKIAESSGDISDQNWNNFHLAITQYQRGEWETALNTFQSCKRVLDSTNEKLLLALIEKFLGNIYRLKGDLSQSLIHYNQSIALLGVLNDDWNQAETYNKLGLVQLQQGDYHKAHKSFQKSLSMYTKLGARIQSCDSIFNLIRIKLELKTPSQLHFYLKLLENISQSTDDKSIRQKYLIAKALIEKQQNRIINKVEALRILKEVVENPFVDAEFRVLSMIHLTELLLSELLLLQNPEVLDEIEELTNDLMSIATEQRSYNLQIDTLLLNSKLALIKGSAEKSLSLLDSAKELALEHKLTIQQEKIEEEQDYLNNQLSEWEELSVKNASIRKRMELANIENYIDSLLS
jgi:tetratricopeptide (TPR) repeat protein